MFTRRPITLVGAFLVVGFVVVAIAAPAIAPHSPLELGAAINGPPSSAHWLGTDGLGRDELSRVIYGARASLVIGTLAAALALAVGGLLGILTGYFGGWIDVGLMRIVDVFMAFPFIILAILIVASIGPGTQNVILAIGLTGWTATARIVRGETLRLREHTYVEAARALGASNVRILTKHIMPALVPICLTLGTISIGTAIIGEAGLSFLGLGIRPPTPDWGLDLSFGRQYVFTAPFLTIGPSVAIFLAALGFNLVGDGLRDAFDPRARTLSA